MMVSGALFSMALRSALYPAMKSKFSAKTKLSKQFALSTVNSSEVNAGLPSLHVRGTTDTAIQQGLQVPGAEGAQGLNVSLLPGPHTDAPDSAADGAVGGLSSTMSVTSLVRGALAGMKLNTEEQQAEFDKNLIEFAKGSGSCDEV